MARDGDGLGILDDLKDAPICIGPFRRDLGGRNKGDLIHR